MKPNEFYIGVLDLFAILLPGVVATAILFPFLSKFIVGPLALELSTPGRVTAAFLVSAYFVGHLIFLAGSYIDPIYNRLREKLNPYGDESAFACAKRVRDSLIEKNECAALNVFQWSRSVLMAKCSAAAEDVHRLEADSKFFRSLLLVFTLASATFFVRGDPLQGLVSLAFAVACFFRYYERRLKSTTQAYFHVVTLHRLGMLLPKKERSKAPVSGAPTPVEK